ncbi:unnamed protein product [Cylindrotheca closterium]|uniref:Uncharacterized protein n=1 Tax=Cylindrotheca closterium TaxID=2856 RepID=A0AAD2JI23_9STRA|nr:unnamed protein product [Cylindrotheca closterium]
MLISMLACIRMDGPAPLLALLNTRWTASEMSGALESEDRNSQTIVIAGPGFESIAKEVASMLGHRAFPLLLPIVSSGFLEHEFANEVRHSRQQSSFPAEDYATQFSFSDKDALIIFTSGTTGGSKGVRLSHRAIVVQSFAKLGDPCNYSQETTMLASTVPLFHIGGISSCFSVLFAGGKLVFPRLTMRSAFNVNATRRSLMNSQAPANTLVVVPAMLVSILQHSDPPQSFPHVRLILIGGQSAPNRMIAQLEETFPNASIIQTYACTEAASSLTFLQIKQSGKKALPSKKNENQELNGDCVGVPPPHVSIRLYNTSERAKKIINLPYQVGVIATLGPHVMNGYWNRGKQQKNLEGWLLTSDLGFYDNQGRLYFSGRLKDIIRSGGETVLANEVERILLKHSSISECAVFPCQDEKFGEAVACALVTSSPMKLEEIRDWCSEGGLATYKRPRYLFLLRALPRNSSGKILKNKLVARYGRIRPSKL